MFLLLKSKREIVKTGGIEQSIDLLGLRNTKDMLKVVKSI